MTTDSSLLFFILAIFAGTSFYNFYSSLNPFEKGLAVSATLATSLTALLIYVDYFSKPGRERRKRIKLVKEIPEFLRMVGHDSIRMGQDLDLDMSVYFPDLIRLRHVHILGATGTAKTEGVNLNFIRQDVQRGLGTIILDGKGDSSFISALEKWVPKEKLKVFDLGSEKSLTYDPLEVGAPLEAAQRLFSSLTWSEEYYKSKAFAILQRLFQNHFEIHAKNPTILELHSYLENPERFIEMTASDSYCEKVAQKDFSELSGLRDQIRTLSTGHLARILSPTSGSQMRFEDVEAGTVLYFRLQSLISPQLVSILGKLLINHLNYLAGTAHRETSQVQRTLVPVYLDEFASFACPEFADLISKARSAGFALHFSHQSIGDLSEVAEGFLSRITDNSATKIILRVNDPDTADFFARSFGTKLYQKVTQRISNAKELDTAEIQGEGSQREAHQFRASPDLLKTLPTGVAAVLIAHGQDTPHGASTVFKIKFPNLKEEKQI